jgi:hypothetical protein
MVRQFDHGVRQQLECPPLSPRRRAGARGRHQERRLLAGQLARRSRARLLTERQFEIAFHEAALGPVNRGTANRNAARDRRVIDPGVGSQQDLGPLHLAHGMFAAAQHRRERRAFRLAQVHPVPYIHLRSPADEGDDESRGD